MTFVVGKKYTSCSGRIYTCTYISPQRTVFLIGDKDINEIFARENSLTIWKEYIPPPIIHRRYVHWLRFKRCGTITTLTTNECLWSGDLGYFEHIKTDCIELVEEVK